jgi:hypothetical protein
MEDETGCAKPPQRRFLKNSGTDENDAARAAEILPAMKTKLLTLICLVAITFCTVTPTAVADESSGSLEVLADILLVRPGCFIATIFGSVAFVVALPVAALSRSVNSTANTLVVIPAKATFTRPVGDLDSLMEY